MSKFPIGSRVCTILSMTPRREAGRLAVVISYDDFKAGTPSTNAKYSGWRGSDIQQANFIRFLDGPVAGKVSMFSDDLLEADSTMDLENQGRQGVRRCG